jgi:hypothetical protein
MMTGGSASSGSGGELGVSEAEGRCDAGLSGLRCLRLKSLLVFLAIGLDLPLLLLSPTTLGGDDGDVRMDDLRRRQRGQGLHPGKIWTDRGGRLATVYSAWMVQATWGVQSGDEGLPAELIF